MRAHSGSEVLRHFQTVGIRTSGPEIEIPFLGTLVLEFSILALEKRMSLAVFVD
jgi:hypothetical protein